MNRELREKINRNYGDDPTFRTKLLNFDDKAIVQICLENDGTIFCEEFVEAYENYLNNETGKLEKLYEKAKKKLELRALYHELCDAYCEVEVEKRLK